MTRTTLGFAEERLMQLLQASPEPLTATDIQVARKLRTVRGVHSQLRALHLRGLVQVVIPAVSGVLGRKQGYLPTDRAQEWLRAQERPYEGYHATERGDCP